jgi:hypothetical protein
MRCKLGLSSLGSLQIMIPIVNARNKKGNPTTPFISLNQHLELEEESGKGLQPRKREEESGEGQRRKLGDR